MADRSILYRLRAALQGGFVAVGSEIQTLASYVGVLNGVTDIETGLRRLDGTGIGASLFSFQGRYEAQNSNIDEWFGDKQLNRIRCTDDGAILPPQFTLPGTTALNAAFDRLVTLGLPEMLQFNIEYTGPSSTRLRVIPRAGGPQIQGTSSILVASGISASVEITRSSGTISQYVFTAIGQLADGSVGGADAFKFINPSVAVWDASASGVLPSTGVVKGNAYRVVNAPSDQSGRFGEVMQNGDWVVWEGETFTSWAATPHQWSVFPAHEVRRISALQSNFLATFLQSPENDRNTVIRGANYADSAGEIRLKLYATKAGYSAADLNTTGDVDEYTDTSDHTGEFLAIRLTGTQATLAAALPTLYVYSEDSSGNFTRIGNLATDFTHQGDFGGESDYLAVAPLDYAANDTLRIYIGEVEPRYNSPDLDVGYNNLTDDVQARLDRSEPWYAAAQALFGGATVRHDRVSAIVEYATGYSRAIDWRDMSASNTINANRYKDDAISVTVNGSASFEMAGFGVGLRKIIGLQLQRNDGNTGEGAMVEIAPGIALIRVTINNRIQINTTPGAGQGGETWADLGAALGPVTLASGSDNFLAFEMNPLVEGNPDGHWDLVAGFYNGSTFVECNNVTFNPHGTAQITGDTLGISRSVNQRGQVTRFSAIRSPGYIYHSALDDLLRHHRDDRWNFGFAREIVAASDEEVVLTSVVEIDPDTGRLILTASPNGTKVMIIADDTDTSNIALGLKEV